MIRKFLILLALAMPLLAPAQFDFGNASASKPWEQFKLPNKKIKLEFRNANVDMVISLFSKVSGIAIVKDPSLTGPISLTTPAAIPLNDAFQMLSTTLGLKNFDLAKEGNLLVIKARAARNASGRGGFNMSSLSPEMMGQLMGGSGGSNSELRVYPINFASASQVARVINEVFGNMQQAQNPLQMLLGGGGFGQGQGQGGTRFGGAQGVGGRFGGFGGSTVRASYDDYSNTVIVNAPARDHTQVEKLIKDIDKDIDQPLRPRVFKLDFAVASDLVPIIQNVLISNAPKGRGGASNTNVPIEQRFQQAMRTGSFQSAFGNVVADNRTNSLVVTATEDNLVVLEKVVAELDKEITYQDSTFVFPLVSARADQMATLLSQAFGQRNTNRGGNFQNQGTRTGTQNQNRNTNPFNQNRNNGGNGGGNGGGGFGGGGNESQASNDGSSMDIALEDPNADFGELYTSIGIQGGAFGQLFGGGGQGQGQVRPTQGRDSQGRLVNVRDLSGQVTIIPDPNTNSLIVVTGPENVDMIRSILAQLDRIPEQVMIETIIIEATLDNSSKFGVEWNYVQNKAFGDKNSTGSGGTDFGNKTANPPLQGFKYSLTGGDLTAFLNMLQTDKKFQVLSTPRIFTSNNVQAEINISQRVPYVLSTREDANGNLTFNYAFQDVGIVLTVTPRITANGLVTMDVVQTANDLQGFTDFNAPLINQRQAQTTVSVKDGETIILGGIIRKSITSTVKKIPLLGDIPILGNLFKSTDKSDVKTELLVFLTPRVVRDPAEAQRLREEEQKRLSKQTQDLLKKSADPKKTGGGEQKAPTKSGGKGN